MDYTAYRIGKSHFMMKQIGKMSMLLTVTDINECSERTHNCHESATCSDVVGGFICTCDTGFTGNGTFCEGKSGCSSC